jgi:hypothetical protein
MTNKILIDRVVKNMTTAGKLPEQQAEAAIAETLAYAVEEIASLKAKADEPIVRACFDGAIKLLRKMLHMGEHA